MRLGSCLRKYSTVPVITPEMGRVGVQTALLPQLTLELAAIEHLDGARERRATIPTGPVAS